METALEWTLTNSYKADMISYLASHQEDFEELIKLAISDKQPYSWRAAWLLWSCMEENDHRIRRYLKIIIDTLSTKNDEQQRELLILLQKMEIRDELEGSLFNHCVSLWEKTGKKPSVRYNAFKIIVKIAEKHPDLSHEIGMLIQDQYIESLSATVKNSIAKMIKRLPLLE
jgi:hypothetical protein